MLPDIPCPHCNQKQYCRDDKNYLDLFRTCWDCDNERFKKGKITLEKFEERENKAAKLI